MGVQKLSVNPGYLRIYLTIWGSWTEILGAAHSDTKEQGRKGDQLKDISTVASIFSIGHADRSEQAEPQLTPSLCCQEMMLQQNLQEIYRKTLWHKRYTDFCENLESLTGTKAIESMFLHRSTRTFSVLLFLSNQLTKPSCPVAVWPTDLAQRKTAVVYA